MLPNRFSLTRQTEEKLKRDKLRTGTSPNIAARQLFFISIESGKTINEKEKFESGTMMLDKSVWLGSMEPITLLILNNLYGSIEREDLAVKWALHIQHGLEVHEKHRRA